MKRAVPRSTLSGKLLEQHWLSKFLAGILGGKNVGTPNTKITIAGLGFVIVNEQHITITSTGASVTVDAFDLHVTTANSFGLPVGVRIIVGHTEANVATA